MHAGCRWVCGPLIALASGCAFPGRHRLPELHVQLLDQSAPVSEAKVGYSWEWGQDACERSLEMVYPDPEGGFVLMAKSTWAIRFITPIPDYDRDGWQICLETPGGERHYYAGWAVPKQRMWIRCDLTRPTRPDVCEVISAE